VIFNPTYQGLSYETSKESRAYLHMRKPENLQGIALLKRPGLIKTDDFLDCIDRDLPRGKLIIIIMMNNKRAVSLFFFKILFDLILLISIIITFIIFL
jgi:hypothetical protein